MHAIGRIAYHGHIDNVQVSWVKIGVDGAKQVLQAGANDLGGTLIDENISRAAGASHGQGLVEEDFKALAAPLGRTTRQRNTGYGRADGKLDTAETTRAGSDGLKDDRRELLPENYIGVGRN